MYAKRAGIDPNVFVRQINDESGFQTGVTSSAGAQGIAQFMPGTARSNNVNPWDPRSALRGAANLDATLIKQTGSYRNALAAYNAGPGNIKAGLGYADKILNGQSPSSLASRGGGSSSASPTSSGSGVDLSALRDYLLTQNRGSDPTGAGFLGAIQAVQTAKSPAVSASRDSTGSTGGTTSAPVNTSAKGVATFEGHTVAAWIAPILSQARKAGWKGTVNSGLRSLAEQKVLYARYKAGGNIAAKPGQSNHEKTQYPGGAVDVTDPQQLNAVLKKLGVNSLKWAITHGLNDTPHFSGTGH